MKVIAYLNFNGNAEEALEFYKQLFDGEIPFIQRYSDAPDMGVSDAYKNKILHGRLEFGSNKLYVSDNFENAKELKNGNISLTLDFESEAELDKIYEGLKVDANITMELQETFWNAKFASLIDKFGIYWSLNYSHD